MPKVKINGVDIHYRDRGRGFPIVFGHSLTLDGTMFDEGADVLARKYRVIQIDFRGHGESEKPDKDFTLNDVTQDVHGLLTHLKLESVLYIGLSMGGMVGMRFALAQPQLVKGMVLLDTSAEEEPRRKEFEEWAEMTKDVEPNDQTVQAVLNLMLSPGFIAGNGRVVSRLKYRLMKNHVRGVYRASLAVIRRESILSRLDRIRVPVLIVVGSEDIATPPMHAEAIYRAIRGAEQFRVQGAGHLSILEKPNEVIPRIEAFCSRVIGA